MRIIISPAKKMNIDTDSLPWKNLPQFLPESKQILQKLQGMTDTERKKLWKCNDAIAAQNNERIQKMQLEQNLTPAILAYEGIQYRYMVPSVFTVEELEYVEEHLRILSGFYGILRPFDGIAPYRLEMQAKLSVEGKKDLYQFWGNSLAVCLSRETDCILNLASKEYSSCIEPYLPSNVRLIRCVFGEQEEQKIVEKGTKCKMARGAMVRHMAQHKICAIEQIKEFSELDFEYAPEHSDDDCFVFLQK